MKTVWTSTAAVVAILAAAGAALAQQGLPGHEDHDHLAQAAQPSAPPAAATTPAAAPAARPVSLEAQRMGTWGFDLAGRDTSVDPGDDFNLYASGTYLRALQIPADRSRYGAFDALAELSQQRTRAIIEGVAAGQDANDPDATRIAALWRSYMDEARIEQLDARPMQADLAAVRAATTREDIARLMGMRSQGKPYDSLFNVGISDDARAPTRYATYVSQGGLGLPDRDYYLQPQFATQKAAYQAYVAQMLEMAGWENPAERAAQVVAFETRIAEGSWNRVDRRNRDRTYNPMTTAELTAAAPGFPWATFMGELQLGDVQRVVVSENTAVPRLAAAFAETEVETLKAWQAFHVVDNVAPLLSRRFVDAHFAFRGRTLSGQPQNQERWKRGVSFVNGSVGEGVGRLYAARYYPPESQARMAELIANVREAMGRRIQALPWMTEATKREAMAKLETFDPRIGRPATWRDYSAIEARPDDLYGNAQRVGAYEWRRRVARKDGPVDRAEWGMLPQTVNASYAPTRNAITFPAAILQPPFFDPNADPAVNYGAIGGVIGHEISHGFDDQGRKSDGQGMLRDWWTPADATAFEAQATRLGAQYDAFEPLPGARVQGRLTMGENIGDLAGLTIALEAYRASLNGRPAPVIDGLTGEQRVFLGWAQVWRQGIRPERLRQDLATDPHSPAQYRVNGTVRNIDAWYEAFDVQPGDALYIAPADRVRLW